MLHQQRHCLATPSVLTSLLRSRCAVLLQLRHQPSAVQRDVEAISRGISREPLLPAAAAAGETRLQQDPGGVPAKWQFGAGRLCSSRCRLAGRAATASGAGRPALLRPLPRSWLAAQPLRAGARAQSERAGWWRLREAPTRTLQERGQLSELVVAGGARGRVEERTHAP